MAGAALDEQGTLEVVGTPLDEWGVLEVAGAALDELGTLEVVGAALQRPLDFLGSQVLTARQSRSHLAAAASRLATWVVDGHRWAKGTWEFWEEKGRAEGGVGSFCEVGKTAEFHTSLGPTRD